MLYSEVSNYMPSELIDHKIEEDSKEVQADDNRKLFKDLSIHLMPFMRNAFYTKEDVVSSEPGSARSNKADDFYKGAEIMKIKDASETNKDDAKNDSKDHSKEESKEESK
jgi:hypothetical protein